MSLEDTFSSWSAPPGQTEQSKCDNAERAVRKAIEASYCLQQRGVTVSVQGSYRDRTNVRAESDVDVCALYSQTVFFDLPPGRSASDCGLTFPASYPYSEFKNDVENALVSYFGRGSMKRGRKAFDIHENTYRIDADVVPCFEYRRYLENGGWLTGVAFLPDQGSRVVNWPEQNYENGVAKNDVTGRRFKAAVRILKRLRNHMDDHGIAAAKPISSFLIESLVWNVPNEGFGHDSYTADIRWILAHLFNNTRRADMCKEWGEINELKYLFFPAQPWTVEQVHTFTSAAWEYVGFK